MAETGASTSSFRRQPAPHDDLPSLIERLAGDVASLFDQKLSLLRIEVKEEVDAYVRGSILMLAGAIVAAVGLALANVALAFAVSTLFQNLALSQAAKYALGFLFTGTAYLLGGGLLILVTKNRLAKQGLAPPRTMQEFERDKEWIQSEL